MTVQQKKYLYPAHKKTKTILPLSKFELPKRKLSEVRVRSYTLRTYEITERD
jgi:hypothetical protein